MSVLNIILFVIGVIGCAQGQIEIELSELAGTYLAARTPTSILGVATVLDANEDPYFTFGYIAPNVFADADIIKNKGITEFYAATSQTVTTKIAVPLVFKPVPDTNVTVAKLDEQGMASAIFAPYYEPEKDVLVAAFFTKKERLNTPGNFYGLLDVQELTTKAGEKYEVGPTVDEGSTVFVYGPNKVYKGLYGELTSITKNEGSPNLAEITRFDGDFQAKVPTA